MQRSQAMDTVGLTGSAICLIHCLAGPLLLVLSPLLPSVVFDDQLFHQSMLFFVVPVSGVALLIGCRIHRDRATLMLGISALVTLFLAATALHAILGALGERILTVLGSVLLAVAHLRNFRLCRADACDHSQADAT